MAKTCSIKGCDGRYHSRGWCRKHYMRWWKHGNPLHTETMKSPEWREGCKWCPMCKTHIPLAGFNTSGTRRDGYCKECRKKKAQKFRHESPQFYLLRNVKHRARRKNIPFEIDVLDIPIPDKCPVLGIPLSRERAMGNFPSVDRFDNDRGYVKGNVRVISWRANNLKSDAKLWEIEAVALYMQDVVG